jgi:uncharacterized lipoprotein YmbA
MDAGMKPEESRKLWAAVLDQAIKDALSGNLYLKKEARDWFCSKNQDIGSFLWVCSTLDINPESFHEAFGSG